MVLNIYNNLIGTVNNRKEKLLAMCEAQCASLRSRIERRVNRVPSNKRNTKLIEFLEPTAQRPAPTKKEKESTVAPAPIGRRTRPAATTTAPAHPKPAPKSTRGVKRSSDEISAEDKENNTELTVPKKRAKAAPAPRATRTTRAASKKVDPAPQILSPKNNNARPAPQTRTRRQR